MKLVDTDVNTVMFTIHLHCKIDFRLLSDSKIPVFRRLEETSAKTKSLDTTRSKEKILLIQIINDVR